MQRYYNKKIFLLLGASMGWFAVIFQFYLMLQNRVASVAETTLRFFSYFTILTNLLVAFYFLFSMVKKDTVLSAFFRKRGQLTALLVYISIVGIVYQVLLRPLWSPQGWQQVVDELLHSIIPLYVLLFWWLFEDRKGLEWKMIPSWLLYPILYLFCILFRGALSGFYPYPFIDVSLLGYEKVALNSLLMSAGFVFMSFLFMGVAKLTSRTLSSK